MFQKFLSFLGFNTIASLQQRSASTMSVFEKTKTDLNEVNTKLQALYYKNQEEQMKLKAEADLMNDTKVSNQKVIDKITKFFD